MTQTRLDRLRGLAEQDAELSEWLESAVSRWRQGDTLESALGLDRCSAIRARNEALRAAAGYLSDAFPDLSLWQIARLLADEINRFETRMRSTAPPDTAPWLHEIARALHQRCQQVRTQRKLYEIIVD